MYCYFAQISQVSLFQINKYKVYLYFYFGFVS